jgi:HNH endonuclease
MIRNTSGLDAYRKRRSEESIKSYLDNPNICLYCGKKIELNGKNPCIIRVKKFCNRSCAASYNNSRYIKVVSKTGGVVNCEKCGDIVYLKKASSGGYISRRFCDRCVYSIKSENASGDKGFFGTPHNVITKGDIRNKYGKTELFRARVSYVARRNYANSGKAYVCARCGYDKTIQICHIRAIADFGDEATLEEINSINNLVALCPNHHWEFDHGILSIESIVG